MLGPSAPGTQGPKSPTKCRGERRGEGGKGVGLGPANALEPRFRIDSSFFFFGTP